MFKMKTKSQGFTLIELLVVIAIIGILSSVVLASLNTARNKGADAAIKSQLASIRSQAEIVYDNIGSYGIARAAGTCPNTASNDLFGTTTPANVLNQTLGVIGSASGVANTYCVVSAVPSAYAAIVVLKTSNTQAWCVDSTGASKAETITASTPSTGITGSACN